jgi:hypothetical protein
MSDTQDAGSADAGNPAEGNVAPANNGSGGATGNDGWTGLLADEGNRKTVEAKGWATKGLDDVVTSYRELESKLGKAIVPPGDDAKPEDLNAFYAKLGRPEKAEAYEFKLPEGLPENFPYDGKAAEKYKVWAHDAGLPPKQAQALHDMYVKDTAAQLQAHQEAYAKSVEAAHNELVKEWGDPKSGTYERNQELANRAIRQLGGTELLGELKAVGAFGPNGEVKSPKLAKALAKVGESLYAEDTMFGGPTAGANPFSSKTENLTLQGQIIRDDPDRAKVLIRQAGIDPSEYGL